MLKYQTTEGVQRILDAHIKDVFTLVSLKYVAMMMQFQRFYFWRRILVLGNLSVSGLHQILGSLSLR